MRDGEIVTPEKDPQWTGAPKSLSRVESPSGDEPHG